MPTQQEIQDLINVHLESADLLDGALWIQQESPFAWLVEVTPEVPDSAEVLPPFVTGPSSDFQFAIYLIAGPKESILRSVRQDKDLAEWIANGQVLMPSQALDEIIQEARTQVVTKSK